MKYKELEKASVKERNNYLDNLILTIHLEHKKQEKKIIFAFNRGKKLIDLLADDREVLSDAIRDFFDEISGGA